MEKIYVYCVREQAHSKVPACFKIGGDNDSGQREDTLQVAKAHPPRTVFALGPFLDWDEAESVESEVHTLLARYLIHRGRYRVNPLELSEFWEWIEAQILPIALFEGTAFVGKPSALGSVGGRPTVYFRCSADGDRGASDSLVEAQS